MISVQNCSYTRIENGAPNNNERKERMGERLDKFLLLMWKNWLLQYRRPIQTLVEILAPVLFSILLVVIRSLVDPELRDTKVYHSFCTIPITSNDSTSLINTLCPNNDNDDDDLTRISGMISRFRALRDDSNDTQGGFNFSDFQLLYSPRSEGLEKTMDYFGRIFGHVISFETSGELNEFIVSNSSRYTFAAIQFHDKYHGETNLSNIKDLKVSIRFPGETRLKLDPFGMHNWRTNLMFPIFQVPGPRQYKLTTGAAPSYYAEGFLAIQHVLTLSYILAREGFSPDDTFGIWAWLQNNPLPLINMRRFAYAQWYEDLLLTALESMIGIIMMLSFVYTCINTVKSITTEKEKQLKEAMKIMGLPNWLHWMAWFLKTFIFLFISAMLIVLLLKVQWYTNTDFTVFTHADPSVMLVFLICYICATITFCFAVSVFFSKANTAATVAGLAWFLSYAPYLFMQEKYDTLGLSTKLIASLGSNTAMAFGFQVMLMYEGIGEGIQWNNVFQPSTIDDNLSLGLIMVMLLVDSLIYLFVALYVEAIFPGEYGVAKPWYFLFTSSFWCGESKYSIEDSNSEITAANDGEYFESEPKNLPAGIEIKNLRKVFGNKAAVRNLSLNMYEGQITVLLGHNGAGKTTTMSMLTGLITPNSGTARVNGYDIRTNMGGVRSSLGLCPQHNVIFDEMTVSEHLYFFSKLKGLSKNEIKDEIDKYINLLELEPKRNAKSATLSGGMKRKLSVGVALCGNSRIVMLDEPTAGMDPSARRALWDLLQCQKEGRTMLLTTHFMDEADLLGDRIAIMAGGELQCCGSSFFLKKKYGAGYSLIMDISKNADASKVTALLRKYIPDIEIHSNVGSELTYLLVEHQSSLFEPMLRELEEKSAEYGINSYGISLTTLEEVFMKVGADHGQEEIYNDTAIPNGITDNVKNNMEMNGDAKITIAVRPSYTGGWGLLKNQFLAMVMKKFLSNLRSWVLLLIQIAMPVLFLIIAIVVSRSNQQTGDLPSMPLTLDKFEDPITLVQNIDDSFNYFDMYKNVLHDSNHDVEEVSNMTDIMVNLTSTIPNTVRRRYIAGASFENTTVSGITIPNITAWFNNDPYHSPAITLGLVLNAMLKILTKCSTCTIDFTNSPMPFTADTQIQQLSTGQNMGFNLAFNIAFSMAFVSSFYVLFTVRENISKSKHLQFVSGVKVYIFWITSLLCDMVTYFITVAALVITLACFQEDGFSTAGDIGRLVFILAYFGWAFLPMLYLAAYIFDVPSTGYTRMTLFSIFTGVAAFLVVQVLSTEGLNLEDVGKALHWVFLALPHYSLATGIMETYKMYLYGVVCARCPNGTCFDDQDLYHRICDGVDGNYFKWEAPGIGRNILFSFIVGIVLFGLLLCIEYELFAKIVYFINKRRLPGKPGDDANEDSDVAEEKEKIRNATENEIKTKYTLVLRDLTKYYKSFLAVNSLCLGINNYECFGLLGVNGAGKTTTFKMMTGDVKVSYGDGWVNGFSIKKQIKQVQKAIGYCPQFDALLDDMTAKETMVMFSLLRGIRYSDCIIVAENLAREFDFLRHLNKKVKELSGGNKRKLSTAISLIGDPPVIYLDEPTTGMDPATKRYLWNALCKIRDNGKCVVLTSHSMEECEALCTRLAIMVNGNFKCLGSTQHLKNKFAEGYTLVIKIKKEDSTYQSDVERIERFIGEHFPGAKLREQRQELINYYITDKSIPWSKMFGVLEEGKRSNLSIEDYSLGQSSLEQVFLTFTRQQYIV